MYWYDFYVNSIMYFCIWLDDYSHDNAFSDKNLRQLQKFHIHRKRCITNFWLWGMIHYDNTDIGENEVSTYRFMTMLSSLSQKMMGHVIWCMSQKDSTSRSCKWSDTLFQKSLLLFSTWREYFYSQPTHFYSQPKK